MREPRARLICLLLMSAALLLGGCEQTAPEASAPSSEAPESQAALQAPPAAPGASGEGQSAPTASPGQAPSPEAAAAADHAGCAAPAPAPSAAGTIPAGATQHFGAPFTLDDAPLTLGEALAQAEALGDQPVRIKGHVRAVCRAKGCWMQLDPPSAGAEPVRVTFKDYGFFVPTDGEGTDAVLEGTLTVSVETEAMRRHYAQDAGKSPDEIARIVGDLQSVKFVATAVELTRPATN